MKMKKRPKIFIGKWGTGKTTKTTIEIAGRDYVSYYASDIKIDDPYSIQDNLMVVIEEVNIKPQKEIIMDLIHAGVDLVLTSHNKKDVPKEIINACEVKMCGSKNHYQNLYLLTCKNMEKYVSFNDSIWNIMSVYVKSKNRNKFYKDLVKLSPPPMQLISWAIATFPENPRLQVVSSMMNRLSKDYFYAIFAYSWDGGYRKIIPPHRKANNPYPAIAVKLGFKADETYILKRLIKEQAYAEFVSKKLTEAECRLIGVKKKKRSTPKIRPRKKLEDFI
jgi:hypothetical protein